MAKIFKCLKGREWAFLFVSIILLIIQVSLDLSIPDYMGEITQLVQTEGSSMDEILHAGGIMLACSLGSLVVTIVVTYFSAQIATTVAMRLREQVYDKTISFSAADINSFSIASLITRSTNDITQVQNFLAIGYIALVRAPLMAVWAITKISAKSSSFTSVTLIFIASLLIVIAILLKASMPKSKRLQTLTDGLNNVAREHLTGIRVVRAYNAEKYQEDKFENVNQDITQTNTFINRATGFFAPYMTFLMSTLTIVIYWVGVYLINDAQGMEKITIFSDMVVFSSYAMQIIMAFMMMTMLLIVTPRTMVVLKRITEVLDFDNSVVEGNKADVPTANVAIEFKDVCFSYGASEENVLDNISFKVNKGETIAFIGATGSGKSTILQLMLRNYDATSGQILIDGVDIKEYKQSTLQDKFGYIPQKAVLFTGDVKNNVAYCEKPGLNIDASRVKMAVQIAQAEDFVDKIGLDGEVSQGGLNLSGGQKQRLSIARALYKKAPMYLFDDCFSALDYKTDFNLRDAIAKQLKNTTKVFVAQRISTVKDCNIIVVLDGGKIVGKGTHRELLANCKVYQEIVSSQLSSKEAEL
ncbi:MAG: multidrug ABC transporter ATP-binding protein [Epulopiscium sp. Nele67-Bin004]|nr:MAG: multidrug ABC transporter ATP-binding protein [Epulopiscium sp. Nele67-Bin004]